MQFKFPEDPVSQFKSRIQAKNWLLSELTSANLGAYCSYKVKEVKDVYLYLLCRYCRARMVYKKTDGTYNLAKFSNQHSHKKKHCQRLKIIEAINDYPDCFTSKIIKTEIMFRFGVSESTFYRYLNRAKFPKESVEEVLQQLEKQGIFGVKIYQNNQNIPTLLLLTSQQMIQSFYDCGKIVRFDLTYNLIRERTENNSQYSVGSFVAVCNNLQIRPICLVILEKETKEMFTRLFHEFFLLMRSKPNLIITDEQKSIKYALQDLKQSGTYEGQHFLDLFHVLRNIRNQLFIKQSMCLIVALAESENAYQYKRRYEKCKENLIPRDFLALQRHEHKFQSCCLAQLPNKFIGMSSSTNCCEKLNDLIKRKIPYSQKYSQVILGVCQLFQKIPVNQEPKLQKFKVESLLLVPEIKKLRYSINKSIFKCLMKQISLSLNCLIGFNQDQKSYSITQQQFEDQEPFIVGFIERNGRWTCSCYFSDKVGIPCCHIVKVLLFKKESLLSAINNWWLIPAREKPEKPNSNRICFPRKTRRAN